jgi:hypothetical protein
MIVSFPHDPRLFSHIRNVSFAGTVVPANGQGLLSQSAPLKEQSIALALPVRLTSHLLLRNDGKCSFKWSAGTTFPKALCYWSKTLVRFWGSAQNSPGYVKKTTEFNKEMS